MRKLKLFFACLLMAVLSIGQMWADTSTMEVSASNYPSSATGTSVTGTNSITWAVTSDATYWNGNDGGAIHGGSKSGTVSHITFTSGDFAGKTITSIKVTARCANSAAKASATVNGSAFGDETAAYGNSLEEKEISATGVLVTGDVIVTVARPSATTKAIYVSKIIVTYTTAGSPTLESITIDGTLDKDTYEEGELFDPTGLVATGHYDNSTTADLTSSVEWAYTPAGALTQGLTSVNVTATKGTVVGNKDVNITVNAALPKSSLIFTAACEGSGTANDGVEWTVESDAAESNFDSNRGVHYGTGTKAVSYIELTSAAFSDKIKKIEVEAAGANTPSISITVGGEAFGETATGITNSNVKYTFEPTPAQSGTEFTGVIVVRLAKESSATGALYVKSVVVTYESDGKEAADLAYDDADLSNLVKLGDAFTAPTLTNPHSLTVAYESSNTDVAEVNASTGALNIKAVGIAEITASFAGDDDYKAGSAQYALYVVAHEGTEADPYTVADARVVIDKVGETGIADKYATGIVSKIVTAYNSTYGNITYDISDDGTTEAAQLRAYRGFDKDGEWFTSEDDVMVGDEVVVKGLLKKFNSTYEFDAENQLVSLNRSKEAAGLAYAETAIEKNIDADEFINPLTNPNGLTVTYSSSDENLAVVDENTGEVLVGNKEGTVTITASTNGDATHLSGTATYTITINDPSLTKVTFDATIDIATDNAEGVTKSGINIITSHTDGVNDQSTSISYYQTFKNKTLTVTSTVGNIKKIDFITTGSSYSANGFEGVTNEKWSGDASEIVLTASGNQVRMSKIIVSYIPDTRAETGLEYAETAIEKEVGDDAFINALTNPHSVAVTYESSDTDVAEVASDGTVTIKAQGTTTITASFEGNPTYKPASVSYELTVNEPGLDNVTFDATIDYTADASTLTLSKGGFTLTFTNGALNNKENYRLYKDQTITLSSNDYLIKKIEFTCTTDNPISGFADATGLDKANNRWTGEANKVELTASNKQVRIEQMIVYYVEDTRAASGLAWSTDEVEITLGDPFTAASLVNPNGIDAAKITIESSNTNLATVENGVVSLVEDVTGTATITATFAGNATYKPAEFSYTITVNDPTPMIITNPTTYLNFGTVAKDASVEDKTIAVTLTNVASVTATLGGANPEAFSISPASLTESGEITISFIGSTAAVASFAATLTISDGTEGAEDKTVSLSLSVEEVETPVSTTSQWVAATEIADGVQVLIVGVKDEGYYAMGGQASNNRSGVAANVDGEGVLTPGENTMAFTLVATGTANSYYIMTSNNQYLYNASSSTKSYLKTQTEEASWTITLDADNNAVITSVENTNRQIMRFNYNGGNTLFNCYASGQEPIKLYVPKPVTPPTPTYTEVRNGLNAGEYYTMCLDKAVTAVQGGTIWRVLSKAQNGTDIILEEVEGTLDAGRPYIFFATAATLEVAYTGDAVLAPVNDDDNNGLIGSFSKTEIAQSPNNFIIYNNELYYVNSDKVYVGANRAYLNMAAVPSYNSNEPQQGNAPRRRVTMAVHSPQVATGIDALNASDAPVKVLINGQLFIIRGEKMYNVNGQLVK